MAFGPAEGDGQLADGASQGFLVREGPADETADTPGHGAPEARCTVGEVLLQDVNLRSAGVCVGGVGDGAVSAEIVGLDVRGMETVEGLDDGGAGCPGGRGVLGGGGGTEVRACPQHGAF